MIFTQEKMMGCTFQYAFVSDGATEGELPGSLQAPALRFAFVPRTVQSHESLPSLPSPPHRQNTALELISYFEKWLESYLLSLHYYY